MKNTKMVTVTEKNAGGFEQYLGGLSLLYKDGQISKIVTENGVLIESMYGISISVPAPKTKVKKYRLSGTLTLGFLVDEEFDQKYEAEERKREIEGEISGTQLIITPVEVEID